MDDQNHFYLRCVRPQCPFGKKLPVQVVDDELYRNPPTLLFATVDKFAMLAWNKDVGKLFRHCTHELLDDVDAKNFTGEYSFLDTIKQELLRRIESVFTHTRPDERPDMNVISDQIDAFLGEWARRVEAIPSEDKFYYGHKFMVRLPGSNEHRLLRPFGMWTREQSYETLTSMRNVDQSLSARMLIWGE